VEATAVDGTVVTVTPVDNVASFEGRWPNLIVWYGDDGSVIRTVRRG
jgi:hypothetical protein